MGRKRTFQGGKKTRTRNSRRGRPTKPDNEKKRSVSISLTRVQLEILDTIANRDEISRSDVLRELIEGAGYTRAGILQANETNGHRSKYQNWIGPKTGLKACNPHNVSGKCKNVACQAVYSKEGLL